MEVSLKDNRIKDDGFIQIFCEKFVASIEGEELYIRCKNIGDKLEILGSSFFGFSKIGINGFNNVRFLQNTVKLVGKSEIVLDYKEESSCLIAGNSFIDCDNGIEVVGNGLNTNLSTTIQKNSFTKCKNPISLTSVKFPVISLNEYIFTEMTENLVGCGTVERPIYDQLLMRRETPSSFIKRKLPAGYKVFTFKRGGDENMSMEEYIDNWFKVCPQWSLDEFYNFYNDERIPEDGFFLILDDNGNAVAHSNVQIEEHEKNSATVHFVEVSESARGHGLGYAVSEIVLDYVQKQNIPVTYLTTDEFRMGAIKIYLNLGFKPVYYNDEVKNRWKPILEILER